MTHCIAYYIGGSMDGMRRVVPRHEPDARFRGYEPARLRSFDYRVPAIYEGPSTFEELYLLARGSPFNPSDMAATPTRSRDGVQNAEIGIYVFVGRTPDNLRPT